MGTNYYLHFDVCEHCDRSDHVMHIGKSSAGWRFSFRGYRLSESGYPDLDMIEDAPMKKIQSEDDWRKMIEWATEDRGARIKDEYMATKTPEEFWEWVEAKRDGRSHHEYCLASEYTHEREHGRMDTWHDEKGNSFTGREFS